MRKHITQQGEDLLAIAKQYRIVDWEAIYNHAANKRLKKYRPDPMALKSGDVVWIPDTQPLRFTLNTDQKHIIKIPMPELLFSMQIRDAAGQRLAGKKYSLTVGQQPFAGNTDGDGQIIQTIPASARQAQLTVWPDDADPKQSLSWTVNLGDLDSANDISGIQARLNQAGLEAGRIDDDYGPVTHESLHGFKQSHKIEADLTVGNFTQIFAEKYP